MSISDAVEQEDGDVQAEDGLSKGNDEPVWMQPEREPLRDPVAPLNRRFRSDVPLQGARILWVEDNLEMREFVSGLLDKRFQVEAVADGLAALKAARANPPDLILSDVMMPNLDGFGLLQALRSDPQLGQIPIILLSALDDEGTRIEGMELGADDYLVKPFSTRELLARIEAHLRLVRFRREAADAVRESERRYRDIFEMAGVSVWLEDFTKVKAAIEELRAQGVSDFPAYFRQHPEFVQQAMSLVRLIDVNQETLDLFGAKRKEELLRSLANIFVPETEPMFIEELIAVAEGFRTLRAESPLRTLDGRSIWVLFTIYFNTHAGDYSRVVVTLTDITQRKRAEEALKESEARFSRFMDHLPGLAWIKDVHGRYTYANDAAEKVFQTPLEKLLGKTDEEIFPPEIAAQFRENDQRALASGMVVQVVETLEHEDGILHYSLVSKFPIPGPDGRLSLVGGMAIDITDRKRAEEALQQLNDELEQRVAERTNELEQQNKRLRRLANQLSETEQRERRKLAKTLHDGLQQILIAGKIQLSLLLNDDADKVVEHLEELFNEAISVSRSLTYDLSPPVLHSSDLAEALQWLAHWFYGNYRFEVKVRTDKEIPVMVDHIKSFLFAAVRELLLNSVKHSGVHTATVELYRQQPRQVCIVVADNGRGFEPAKLEQVDPDLYGFGLFSIRERLLAMGGTLEIDSGRGVGTRTVLTISLTKKEMQPKKADTGPLPGGLVSRPLLPGKGERPIRVLIVDDHSIVRRGLIALIDREADIEVVGEAYNGLEAVERADEMLPDVVVMDIDMPEMNGIEATRRIKRKNPQISIIGLSFHEEQGKLEAMRRAGASAYVRKGSDSETLLKTIREM